MSYKYIVQGNDSIGIKQINSDSSVADVVPDSSHYLWAEYLAWKNLGNTPEDAD